MVTTCFYFCKECMCNPASVTFSHFTYLILNYLKALWCPIYPNIILYRLLSYNTWTFQEHNTNLRVNSWRTVCLTTFTILSSGGNWTTIKSSKFIVIDTGVLKGQSYIALHLGLYLYNSNVPKDNFPALLMYTQSGMGPRLILSLPSLMVCCTVVLLLLVLC